MVSKAEWERIKHRRSAERSALGQDRSPAYPPLENKSTITGVYLSRDGKRHLVPKESYSKQKAKVTLPAIKFGEEDDPLDS